jgi:hypothetical protein
MKPRLLGRSCAKSQRKRGKERYSGILMGHWLDPYCYLVVLRMESNLLKASSGQDGRFVWTHLSRLAFCDHLAG